MEPFLKIGVLIVIFLVICPMIGVYFCRREEIRRNRFQGKEEADDQSDRRSQARAGYSTHPSYSPLRSHTGHAPTPLSRYHQ